MRRSHVPIRLVLIALGVTTLFVAAGCSGGADASTNRTLRFTTKNDLRSVVDLGAVGPSQGDLLAVEGDVFRDGVRAGRFDLSYTTTDVDGIRERKVGTGVIEWDDGAKLLLQSANEFALGAAVPPTTEHVIVGGTKEYLGATGVCGVAYEAGTFDWTCTLRT